MSDRDAWCTPSWLTAALPMVDLDPCSNSRSTVKARQAYSLDRGEDGLALPWVGSVFVNPPYSDILPWAEKAKQHAGLGHLTACGFLVNVDTSTKWWHMLSSFLPYALLFNKRIQFDAPPGINVSGNSKPQALLCNRRFLSGCELDAHTAMWMRSAA
jgi:hypothetical protein